MKYFSEEGREAGDRIGEDRSATHTLDRVAPSRWVSMMQGGLGLPALRMSPGEERAPRRKPARGRDARLAEQLRGASVKLGTSHLLLRFAAFSSVISVRVRMGST